MRFADASSDACAPMSRRSLRCTCHCTQCSPLNPLPLPPLRLRHKPRLILTQSRHRSSCRVAVEVGDGSQLRLLESPSGNAPCLKFATCHNNNNKRSSSSSNKSRQQTMEVVAGTAVCPARCDRSAHRPTGRDASLSLSLTVALSLSQCKHPPSALLLRCRTVAAAQINFIILVGCSRGSRVSLLMRDESAAAAAEAAETASVVVGFVWAHPDSPHPACQPSLTAVSKTTTNQAIRGQPQFKCLRFVSLRFL